MDGEFGAERCRLGVCHVQDWLLQCGELQRKMVGLGWIRRGA